MGLIQGKKTEAENLVLLSLVVKKIYNFKVFHGQKYADNCGSEVADFRKSCDCEIAVAE